MHLFPIHPLRDHVSLKRKTNETRLNWGLFSYETMPKHPLKTREEAEAAAVGVEQLDTGYYQPLVELKRSAVRLGYEGWCAWNPRFCFSGDFLFWALLRYLLGIFFFSRRLKQI